MTLKRDLPRRTSASISLKGWCTLSIIVRKPSRYDTRSWMISSLILRRSVYPMPTVSTMWSLESSWVMVPSKSVKKTYFLSAYCVKNCVSYHDTMYPSTNLKMRRHFYLSNVEVDEGRRSVSSQHLMQTAASSRFRAWKICARSHSSSARVKRTHLGH